MTFPVGAPTTPVTERAQTAFDRVHRGTPTVLVRSPGRVNLIGDHTDYNDGLALPLAIDIELCLAARPRRDGRIRLWSEVDGQTREESAATIRGPARWPDWTIYVQGAMQHALADPAVDDDALRGGVDIAITSDLPDGAGLSSSAAVELAVVRLIEELIGLAPDAVRGARWGREAENQWVGVSTGIMDQLAVACARRGHALMLDCRDESWTHVPLPQDIDVLILDTGARRTLVGSAYDDRRRDCADAADRLGVVSLRDVDSDNLSVLEALPSRLAARVRHVLTENARVRAVAVALAQADHDGLALALNQSHASLRDDYQVSGPELDVMAEVAQATPGIIGARMTGGGFAGAVVALAHRDGVDQQGLLDRYLERVDLPARVIPVTAAAGTSVL